MRTTRLLWSGLLLLGLVGCATTRTSTGSRIAAGEAQLVEDTIQAHFVSISGVALVGAQRVRLSVYTSDCSSRSGTLHTDVPSSAYTKVEFPHVFMSGSTPPDRLFAQLCTAGMPMVEAAEDARQRRRATLTPEQRAAEDQQNREAAKMMLDVLTGERR